MRNRAGDCRPGRPAPLRLSSLLVLAAHELLLHKRLDQIPDFDGHDDDHDQDPRVLFEYGSNIHRASPPRKGNSRYQKWPAWQHYTEPMLSSSIANLS